LGSNQAQPFVEKLDQGRRQTLSQSPGNLSQLLVCLWIFEGDAHGIPCL